MDGYFEELKQHVGRLCTPTCCLSIQPLRHDCPHPTFHLVATTGVHSFRQHIRPFLTFQSAAELRVVWCTARHGAFRAAAKKSHLPSHHVVICVGLLRPALSYSRRIAIDAAADAAREDRRRVAEPGVLSEARDTGVG